jgi:hypothetical protein
MYNNITTVCYKTFRFKKRLSTKNKLDKMNFKRLITITIVLLFGNVLYTNAQNLLTIDGYTILPVVVIDGDTIPNAFIPQVVVFPTRVFKNKRDYRQYQKLIRNIKIVYPYAQIAKIKISEMDNHFRTLKTDIERNAYTKQVEKELRNEFESQLTQLTVSQGKLLIKLIDRELGRTTYEVIKDLKGGVSAVFWQTVARLFGSNLKTQFDAIAEDQMLNELIILHENGLL